MKFNVFWNYKKNKKGKIIISENELQKMLDAAYESGFNKGKSDINLKMNNKVIESDFNNHDDPRCSIAFGYPMKSMEK